MSKSIRQFLIVFLLIGSVNLPVIAVDVPFVSDVQDLISLAHDIGDIAAGNVPLKGYFVETVNPINVIMDTVTQLVDQVTNLGAELNGKLDSVLNAVLVRVPLEGKIDDDMKEIIGYMAKIDRKYDDFEIYTEFPEDYAERTIRNHIDYVIGTDTGDLQDLLHSMLLLIIPPKAALQRTSLLENIKHLRNISDITELCDLDMSFQYRLYKIYNILMITELKAFMMTQFAYKQLSELDDPKGRSDLYYGEMKRAQAHYIMRACQYQLEVKKILQGASREVFHCAPKKLIEDETHLELERLFSGYVVNEYQVTECTTSCGNLGPFYSHNPSYSVTVHEGPMSSSTRSYTIKNLCRGQIRDCIYIGPSANLCENPPDSKKRYTYVRSHSQGWYKDWASCDKGQYCVIESFNHKYYDCDPCLCTCFEDTAESTATRTLNLRPQLSNIAENKVVSNLRFILKDKMLHMQIEEAPLLAVGLLNTNYTSWVPIEDFEYFSNVTDEGGFMLKNGDEYSSLTKDEDYAFIKYDRRRINLDEISVNAGYVVTGVRWNFENKDNKVNSNFQLEVHFTPFNFSSGKLAPTDDNPSIWLTSTTQPNPPVEYTQERIKQWRGHRMNLERTGTLTPVIMKNRHIEIGQSSFWSDAGDSTIPYFDARTALSFRNLAFDGIGHVFYESDNDHAGIIGMKVMTIDMVKYVKPELKGSQVKYYKKLYREPLRHQLIKTA